MINPADESTVAEVAYGGRADAERAIEAAARAFPAWRARLGLRPGQGPEEDRRPDARAGRRDRPDADPGAGQAACPRPRPRCCTRPTRSSGSPRRASGPTAGSSRPSNVAKRHYAIKHPVGVVGTITPWNFPAALPSRKIAPALAVGCTIVSRPADQTPLTLIQMFECLADAGLPPGVANLVMGAAAADRRRLLRAPGGAQDQLHRLDRGRQGADPALGRPGQAAQPGTRRPRPA